ncbi:MAG: UDP-N-acetylglucosamine 1-carboxyvinyltransferase [Candidatus Omnitrophica bacterium]|nr:UDP-N-acetylglucosamine 1-carboxyvinyltransferase [Candidatus Omnitrophota bacterium]
MDKLIIEGSRKLKGSVRISGAKNACLPILAATLLADEKCVIKNSPNSLRDIMTMLKLLKALGMKSVVEGDTIIIEPVGERKSFAPYKLVSTMRASVCVLGPLVGKLKQANVSFPGGCIIGPRPIDLHFKGISRLGVDLKIKKGYIVARAKELHGADIYLGGHFGSSVLATANTMMAAVLAKGKTVIESAACEPEVKDLADFLVKMGAKIKGHGSPRIEIEGVKRLGGAEHSVIPDRIEAGTYIIASAITDGDIIIKNANLEHLTAVTDKLTEAGVSITRAADGIRVRRKKALSPVDATMLPYPGFPTDMQAQMMSLMSVTKGISVITEKIYPGRFMHVSELNRMGAQIHLEGPSAIVKGIKRLSGAPVMASDLRASAALVLAGLAADDKTEISRVYHLDRGYERIEEKLRKLGARIWREKEI